jgi:hypothetical protein
MIRSIGGLLALLLSASATFGDPMGTYELSGSNPLTGSKYAGTVVVQRTGDTFLVVVTTGSQRILGIGIGKQDYFAVSYALGNNIGLAVYTETDQGWTGIWAPAGSRVLGTEHWRRTGLAHDRSVPSPNLRWLHSYSGLSLGGRLHSGKGNRSFADMPWLSVRGQVTGRRCEEVFFYNTLIFFKRTLDSIETDTVSIGHYRHDPIVPARF